MAADVCMLMMCLGGRYSGGMKINECTHLVMMFVGGRYSGEMKINECTHLVLTEAKGVLFTCIAVVGWLLMLLIDS